MTKFKRLMALAAVSMLGIQLMGVGTAFAVESECDFGSDNLEISLGLDEGGDSGDVDLWMETDGKLYCQDDTDTYSQAASSIDDITVAMDDDDSDGQLTIYLEDENNDAAEWVDFDSFDIDVTTVLVIDGSSVGAGAANDLTVKFGASTFSFSGTSGTYAAGGLEIYGGDERDSIDASKATVAVDAWGGDEDDTIKGGSKNDELYGDGCEDGDVLYGNAGNDYVLADCGEGQAWGGEGHDTVEGDVTAPGAGNDDVCAYTAIVYADLTDGLEWIEGDTAGAAGDDDIDSCGFYVVSLGQGDDLFVDYMAVVKGNGGDDVIKTDDTAYGGAGDDFIAAYDDGGEDNAFYGNAGDDVLRGKSGNDELRGGPGSDQSWGGNGSEDLCTAEVMNRCELIKK